MLNGSGAGNRSSIGSEQGRSGKKRKRGSSDGRDPLEPPPAPGGNSSSAGGGSAAAPVRSQSHAVSDSVSAAAGTSLDSAIEIGDSDDDAAPVAAPPLKRAKLEPVGSGSGASGGQLVATDRAALDAEIDALLLQFPRGGVNWLAAVQSDGFHWNADGKERRSVDRKVSAFLYCPECKKLGTNTRKTMCLFRGVGWRTDSLQSAPRHVHPQPAQPRVAKTPLTKQNKDAIVSQLEAHKAPQAIMEAMIVEAVESGNMEALLKVPSRNQLRHLSSTVSSRGMAEKDLFLVLQQFGPEGKNSVRGCRLLGSEASLGGDAARTAAEFNPCFLMATTETLSLLVENPQGIVYVDGTFDLVAHGLQVASINVNLHGYGVPVAFFVSSGRTTGTYAYMLQELRCATSYRWNPKAVIVDFELALQNAFLSVFPGVEVWGCYFHFTQAIGKFLDKHKASIAVSRKDVLDICRHIFLAVSVPLHLEAVEQLRDLVGFSSEFFTYFQRTFYEYVSRQSYLLPCCS